MNNLPPGFTCNDQGQTVPCIEICAKEPQQKDAGAIIDTIIEGSKYDIPVGVQQYSFTVLSGVVMWKSKDSSQFIGLLKGFSHSWQDNRNDSSRYYVTSKISELDATNGAVFVHHYTP